MNSYLPIILVVYVILHSPAIILVIVGLVRRKTHPENSKMLFTIAGIYFLIGAGICGLLLS
jgi:hypothetical protein